MSDGVLGAIDRRRWPVSFGLWLVGAVLVSSGWYGAPDWVVVLGFVALMGMAVVASRVHKI